MNLTDKIISAIEPIANKYDIKGLVLYGSMVHRTDTANDVDICYIRKGRLSFDELLDCIHDLSNVFNRDKVDLVYWSDASPLLKNEMALTNQKLYGEESFVNQYLNAGQRMYWDHKKYYDLTKEKMIKDASHE